MVRNVHISQLEYIFTTALPCPEPTEDGIFTGLLVDASCKVWVESSGTKDITWIQDQFDATAVTAIEVDLADLVAVRRQSQSSRKFSPFTYSINRRPHKIQQF